MTYSYSGPLTYGQQQPMMYDGMTKKEPSSIPYGIGGLVLGAAGGGIAGSKINPYVSKSGVATDIFSSKVMSNLPEADKKIYNQCDTILQAINKSSTPEELQTLLTTNKEAADKVLGNPNDFMQNVTEENLAANKKTLKEKFSTEKNTILQDTKNQIQACWDKEKKAFEKADSVKQEMFDAIKNSTKGLKTKITAKYAAISGLAAGAIAFVAHKIFSNKNA